MGVATGQTLSRVFSAMAAERAKKRRKLVLTPVNVNNSQSGGLDYCRYDSGGLHGEARAHETGLAPSTPRH